MFEVGLLHEQGFAGGEQGEEESEAGEMDRGWTAKGSGPWGALKEFYKLRGRRGQLCRGGSCRYAPVDELGVTEEAGEAAVPVEVLSTLSPRPGVRSQSE